MKLHAQFSFGGFVELLRRMLEASIVTAWLTRTALMVEWWLVGGRTSRRLLIETIDYFWVICVLLFLLVVVYQFCVAGRRAAGLGLRALVYIVLFLAGPFPLGVQSFSTRERPNQAVQRTAGRSPFRFRVAPTFSQQPRTLPPAVADLVSR